MYKNINGILIQIPEIVKPIGAVALYINDAKTGKLKSFEYFKNMYVTAGKVSLARRQRGLTENNQGEITYCAVGTSSVAPELTNTKLGSELTRKLISVREENSGAENANDFTTFFTTSEANGTIEEFGLFGDAATIATDSGTLFCRTLRHRVKTTNDTMTVIWTVLIG